MSLNCNEINLIIQELSLEGAFIQDIIQPGFDALAFYAYKEGKGKTVLVCTAQNSVRINETRKKIVKNPKPLRFMEFLRSKIKGCRINSFSQIGLERVIKAELSHSQTENYVLYIRLWNNAANVILCDENNLVLDSMFRRPDRYEVKGETFIPPAIIQEKFETASVKFPVRNWQNELLNKEDPNSHPQNFNEYVDYWYGEFAQTLSRESLLEKAEKWYTVNLTKRENALNNLLQKKESFKNAPELKRYGDLILAYGHLISQDSNFLECEDYETGKIVRIVVNPKKNVQENAADYYKNYKKAISGAEEIGHDIEIAKKQIEKLTKQYEEIRNEKNPLKIEQLLRKNSTPKQKIKKNHPGLEYIDNGWVIYVGRDANENDELLRRHVRGEDMWLHVRDFPGGYVFIKAQKNKTIPLDILLDAGNLAVYYSKARNSSKTDLYYTRVKYLRRAKNGPKGLVLPTQEKNLCVQTDKQRLAKLDFLKKDSEF